MVMFPHGRTGGEYTDASHMVKDQMRTIKRNLMKALKENRWDGKSENGVPVGMTPPALNDLTEVTPSDGNSLVTLAPLGPLGCAPLFSK